MNEAQIERIRRAVIGRDQSLVSPYGERLITYADYTASGKPLQFIEDYLLEIQKFYANSHTEDDLTGETMTRLLHDSEHIILEEVGGLERYSVFAAGTGSTGAIQLMMKILGVYIPPATRQKIQAMAAGTEAASVVDGIFEKQNQDSPVVFIGPYEHHSNITPWRESLAELVPIALGKDGFLDLEDLKNKVNDPRFANHMKIGSFSACSNVTGVKTDVFQVARILHDAGALACFDYAASGPYVDITMVQDEENYLDAVYLSPHKFAGGPGSSGLLILNNECYDLDLPPTFGGGGTVDYVSGFAHDYTRVVMEREKSGTPGIIQFLRAALAMQLKGHIGVETIEAREHGYLEKFAARFGADERIRIFGSLDPERRIPILSFLIRDGEDYLHPRFVTTLLNDLFGIQSRAGCSCAGPYGHELLEIDDEISAQMRGAIQNGMNILKPGWVRINLHYLMSEEEVDFLLDAIDFVAAFGKRFLVDYIADLKSGAWKHRGASANNEIVARYGIETCLEGNFLTQASAEADNRSNAYRQYLEKARWFADQLAGQDERPGDPFDNASYERIRWFTCYRG